MTPYSDDSVTHRTERLHRVLAHAGIASRRKCEALIAAGRVRVNGEVVSTMGSRVDPDHDRIEVDGIAIPANYPQVHLMLNKPSGYLSTVRDPQRRPTVLDLVPQKERLYPVGRLDRDSEGLILLTNDGELTERLTHPSFEHEKEYQVWVDGQPTAASLRRLREGLELEDGFTWPAQVTVLRTEGDGTWLRMVIHEGRKRQLRRMCEAIGHPVRRLIRVRIGPLILGDLLPGHYRALSEQEVALLHEAVGMPGSTGGDDGRMAVTCQDPLKGASPQPGTPQRPSGYPTMIAIDGPAAAGKSTVGELLAQELNYVYFDTGVMYRAVTWAALQRGIAITDSDAVTRLAEQARIDVLQPTVQDGRQYSVLVDGQDVTWDLRRPDVERNVSPVSAYPGVRRALTAQQRRIGMQGRVVMVGRDIGTVVLPEAPLKLYLDATVEERARRRYLENVHRQQQCDYEDILRDMRRRDKIDSTRQAAPLRPADDAVVIDTTGLEIEQVMDLVHRLLQD
jgi:cytidylate kinase